MGRSSILIVFLLILFSGCKTKKFVSETNEFVLLNRNELLSRISEEDHDIKNVFFRRSSIKMNSQKGIQSFRSNIFIKKDNFIRVSILAPMGIEVARISFEEGEVKIIDRMNRLVIFTDYNEVYRKFGAYVDFKLLQNILLDEAFSYYSDEGILLNDYFYSLDENAYTLSSIKEKQYDRIIERDKDENLVFHKIWVDPSLILMNRTNLRLDNKGVDLDIEYDEFSQQDSGIIFPENLKIKGKKKNDEITVTISHSNIRFNDDNKISFKIPGKYEKIYR